ncbi:MAG: DUF2807 domain-containing protein [Bacteroidia bacterium]
MKYALNLQYLALIIGFASCGGDNMVNPCPSGRLPKGDTVYQYNEEWHTNPTRFMVYAKSEVTLAKGSFGAYGIEGPKNLIRRLQTYQKGDSLYLDYDLCIFKFSPFKTTVFGTRIEQISIYDSSLCAFDPEFEQDGIEIFTNDRTSGTITGKFGVLSVYNTSENPLNIEGTHDILKLSHSGSDNLDILNANIKTADIIHNSNADIYVAEVETLNVNLNSAGSLYYKGDPVLNVSQGGTGQVVKLD